jgi:hypothetical protein
VASVVIQLEEPNIPVSKVGIFKTAQNETKEKVHRLNYLCSIEGNVAISFWELVLSVTS